MALLLLSAGLWIPAASSFQDLIMSYLGLHWTNDLPGAMIQHTMRQVLLQQYDIQSDGGEVFRERVIHVPGSEVMKKHVKKVGSFRRLSQLAICIIEHLICINFSMLEKRLPIAYMFSVPNLYYRHVSLNNRRQSMKDIIVNNSVLMLIGVERRPRRAWLMSTREAGSSTEDETQDSRSLSCYELRCLG
uniref:Uncharacterized protein n=1 Tax=Aegilops tauschii TaxID=37682 RepID=N1QY06_AEGTA